MYNDKKCVAIVLAGGKGSRMNSDVPKQYISVCGHPILYYCLAVFEESFVDEIVLVCGEGYEEFCQKEIVDKYELKKVTTIVTGGQERYHSVNNGLEAIKECDVVFIHDGARPFVNEEMLERLYEEAVVYGNAIAAVPSKDTVKIADDNGFAVSTPNRSNVWNMQTPQTFIYKDILAAYRQLIEREDELKQKGILITDDAMVMEQFSDMKIKLCMADYRNIKITTPEDIVVAKSYIDAFVN